MPEYAKVRDERKGQQREGLRGELLLENKGLSLCS